MLSTIRERDPELHGMLRTAADLERQSANLRHQLGADHPLTKRTQRAVTDACRAIATSVLSTTAKRPP